MIHWSYPFIQDIQELSLVCWKLALGYFQPKLYYIAWTIQYLGWYHIYYTVFLSKFFHRWYLMDLFALGVSVPDRTTSIAIKWTQ